MVFNEITIYDFVLPIKNCQRHLETTVSKSGISLKAINKTFLVC